MDRGTFQIEYPTNGTVKTQYNFVGELVCSTNDYDIYHERYNSNSEIQALKIGDDKSKMLKDGESIICSINTHFDWEAKYEIQVYCMNIENEDENYIICTGWINDVISIENAHRAKIHIEGTNTVVATQFEKYYGWNINIVDDINCDYSKTYNCQTSVAENFAPNTDVLRIGFEDTYPESLMVEYP